MSGCTTPDPIVITKYKVIREVPPAVWLGDCQDYVPHLGRVQSNADIAVVVDPLVSAIEQCTADKRQLRDWAGDSRGM